MNVSLPSMHSFYFKKKVTIWLYICILKFIVLLLSFYLVRTCWFKCVSSLMCISRSSSWSLAEGRRWLGRLLLTGVEHGHALLNLKRYASPRLAIFSPLFARTRPTEDFIHQDGYIKTASHWNKYLIRIYLWIGR